ncbi:MAG: IgGFc-binding protein [Deltaproteobacteria bacterium]|nr:IgGFc-binding protein [Deltaproteobacteria bacterium]
MKRTSIVSSLLVASSLAAACSPASDDTVQDVPRRDDGGDAVLDVPDVVSCAPGTVVCAGSLAQTCNATGDGWASTAGCAAPTPVCLDGVGCVVCQPDQPSCDGTTARTCRSDGSGWDVIDECDAGAGERCNLGYCTDLTEACEAARTVNSYQGCDYWPVQLSNAGLEDTATFRFALAISNRQDAEAHIEISDDLGVAVAGTVPPNSLRTIELDWNEALRAPVDALTGVFSSSVVRNGAFRLKSDVPVTVYQFNPLRYWGGSGTLGSGSYSNDASLLLPRHVLTGEYIAASRPTFMIAMSDWLSTQYSGGPGVLSIVGLEDGTRVEVRLSSNIQGGAGVDAFRRGDTATFTLDRYDVVQLLSEVPADCSPSRSEPHPADPTVTIGYCDLGAAFDLTGSVVTADKPVAVYSGHDCTFVPYDRWACDHLEEQMFPLQAWGRSYIGSHTQPVADESNMWRVISAGDGNTIRFDPDVHGEATLGRGEWFEFESWDDFHVTGDSPFLLVQYLIGQGSDLGSIGDPAMAVAVPVLQYRTDYNFLSPTDYADNPSTGATGRNYVNVIAPDGATVTLDGGAVSGFTGIGVSGYGVARVEIAGGSHEIVSTDEFGIMCYGYGNYTSYMYPGGLDVDKIDIY